MKAIDTLIHAYASRRYLGIVGKLLDSLLVRPDNDSNTIADIYCFKGYIKLFHFVGVSLFDTLKALQYFDSTLAYNKDYHLAWYNKGAIYLVLNKLDTAIACFRKALSMKNDQIHYWLHYGVALFCSGDENEAKRILDSAAYHSSKSFVSFFFLANELQHLHIYSEAIRFLDSALTRKRDDPDVWFSYGICLREVDSTRNIDRYLDSALHFCDNDNTLLGYGTTLGLYRFLEYSLKFFDKALSIRRERPIGWLYRSWTLVALGDTAEAVACLDSVINYDTAKIFPEVDYFKGWQLGEFGMFGKAIDHLERVNPADLDSEWVIPYFGLLASYYNQLERYHEAAAVCDTLLHLAPNDSSILTLCDSIRERSQRH